jgi:hypothetical protein
MALEPYQGPWSASPTAGEKMANKGPDPKGRLLIQMDGPKVMMWPLLNSRKVGGRRNKLFR